MGVLDRARAPAGLLAVDREVVVVAVVRPDDFFGDAHVLPVRRLLSGGAYQRSRRNRHRIARLCAQPAHRSWRRDALGASAPPAAPSASADGTPTRAALRAVRKSRISHPRCRASSRRPLSGLIATGVPTSDSMGTSL